MSDKSPPGSGTRAPSPAGRRSAIRVEGVLISLVTAAIVFAGGNALVPKPRKHEPPAPAVAPAPAVVAPTPPPPPVAVDASADRHAGDAGDASMDAGASDRPPSKAATQGDGAIDGEKAPARGDDAAAPGGDGGEASGGDAGDEASPDCALAEKDIAREAWRRNWPTICPVADTGKAFILIPIKGSIESAIWELRRKPVREARVNLPNAESQLTLKLYKLRRLGFKDLKIGALDDGNGTRLRVRLMPDAGDPVFDVKDTYAKITVATPTDQ